MTAGGAHVGRRADTDLVTLRTDLPADTPSARLGDQAPS
jgi:hypothetical protein